MFSLICINLTRCRLKQPIQLNGLPRINNKNKSINKFGYYTVKAPELRDPWNPVFTTIISLFTIDRTTFTISCITLDVSNLSNNIVDLATNNVHTHVRTHIKISICI